MESKIKIITRSILENMITEFDKNVRYLSSAAATRAFIKAYPNLGFKDQGTDQTRLYKESTILKTYKNLRLSKDSTAKGINSTIIETATPEDLKRIIKEDYNKISNNNKYKELERKYKFVLEELDLSEKRLSALVSLKEDLGSIYEISPGISEKINDAIPIIMLSDWHFEERVDDYTINGYNHYNLEIATKRWYSCIQNSLKLIKKERQNSNIKNVILWLGGDFITGYIHEELEENNYLSPTEAIRFAKERIISAINFYIKHGDFEKITIVCNYGNHGRTTKKSRISSGFRNSYEWMMYKDIEDYFKGNSNLEFIIPNGLFAYVKVYDYTLRFWHGDTIKYGGGIGGLTIPLIKAIHRMNQQIKADYNFMGHYHQFWEATKDCMVNGSGIGFNAYAQFIGANPEKPIQGFRLLDRKHGMTTKLPIFCE